MKFFLTKYFRCIRSNLVKTPIIIFIIILSVVLLSFYEFGGYGANFQESVRKLVQDIRRTEEMAMLVEEFEGSIPRGGYGVNFDLSNPDNYILFADNGNCIYDSGDIIIEEIKMQGNVKISELYEGGDRMENVFPLNVVFTPPNPIVNINLGKKNSGKIILRNEETNETAAIYINLAGLIEIQ